MEEDDVVPDSEELDSETVILFEPPDEECSIVGQATVPSSTNHDPVEHTPSVGGSVDVSNGHGSPIENQNVGGGESHTELSPGLRWSLRKRKAVQKMPYSLERIKYKQQLEGYDVSNFDEISNRVNIPNVEALRESATLEITSNINGSEEDALWEPSTPVFEDGANDQRSNYGMDSASDVFGNSDFNSNSDSTDDGSATSDEHSSQEEVIFRGRKVNIKTGYRGILPKITWEREMIRNKTTVPKRSRRPKKLDKGVAVRKIHTENWRDQNDKLLSEMIVTDDTANGLNNDEEFYIRNNQELVDNGEIDAINHYYQERYRDGYVTDSLSGPDKVEISIESLSDGEFQMEYGKQLQRDDQELQANSDRPTSPPLILVGSDSEVDAYNSPNAEPVNNNSLDRGEVSAQEYDVHTVNPMLNSPKEQRTSKVDMLRRNKVSRSLTNGKSRSMAALVSPRYPKIRKKSVRRPYYRQSSRQESLPYKPYDVLPQNGGHTFVLEEPSRTKQTTEYHHVVLNVKKDRQKRPVSRKRRHNNKDETAQPFITIVEAMSSSFARLKHRKITSLGESQHKFQPFNVEGPLEDVFECLKKRQPIESPSVIKICLSGREYTLSVYNPNETLKNIDDIFNYILDIGVTDTELMNTLGSMARFLVNFNNSAVYEVVDNFHRRFRAKVSSLRLRARTVHFYAVAICQLLLLEVSRYSVTPTLTCSKIEREILDHVISFFKLLSLCYNTHTVDDEDNMGKSYHILATVIDILNFKDLLWDEVRRSGFTPRILLIICGIFPTKGAMWNSLTLRQEYYDLADSFRLVDFCVSYCNWSVTDELILIYDNLFKKRRFSDFAEEKELTARNTVLSSPNKRFSVGTQFNRYLNLIRNYPITNLTIEKITPMGQISFSDSSCTIINKLNLLIVLSSLSRFNLENRFQDLIRPLFGKDLSLEKIRHNTSIEILGGALLNSTLSMLTIGSSKGTPSRLQNVISSIFKTYVDGRESMEGIWSKFLIKLTKRFDKLGRYRPQVLLDLFSCYTSEERSDKSRSTNFILMSLIIKNLRFLDPSWVQKFLMPAIKVEAQKSIVWVNNYCKIGEYLVDCSVLSWWSLYTYNSLDGGYDIKVRFNTKLVRLCDTESFEALRKPLFTFATEHLLDDDSNTFNEFLEALAGKESGLSSSPSSSLYSGFPQGSTRGLVSRLNSFFRVLSRLGYNDLMLKLLDQVATKFESKKLSKETGEQIINYLDKNYIDTVKNHPSFILLRRKLNISSFETERSEFRDDFSKLDSNVERACFVERLLLKSLTDESSLPIVEDKIGSLFGSSSVPLPIFSVFQYLVRAHASIRTPHLKGISESVLAHLLRILNKALSSRFYQFTDREFNDICGIYLELCKRWGTPRDIDLLQQNVLYQQMLEFELNVLNTSSGFLEYSLLLRATQRQFPRSHTSNVPDRRTSPDEIQELLQEHVTLYDGSSFIQVDKKSMEECQSLLEKWIEHTSAVEP